MTLPCSGRTAGAFFGQKVRHLLVAASASLGCLTTLSAAATTPSTFAALSFWFAEKAILPWTRGGAEGLRTMMAGPLNLLMALSEPEAGL